MSSGPRTAPAVQLFEPASNSGIAHANGVQLIVQDIVAREWGDNLESARRDGEEGILTFTETWQIAIDLAQPAQRLPCSRPGP